MKKTKKKFKARDWNILKILQGFALGRHKIFKDKTKYKRNSKHKRNKYD